MSTLRFILIFKHRKLFKMHVKAVFIILLVDAAFMGYPVTIEMLNFGLEVDFRQNCFLERHD